MMNGTLISACRDRQAVRIPRTAEQRRLLSSAERLTFIGVRGFAIYRVVGDLAPALQGADQMEWNAD